MGVRVGVVGGGVTGLAAAWELALARRAGADIEVWLLEGSPVLGGKLRLTDLAAVPGVPIDVGAESVLARRPEALELMTELGLSDDVVHPAAVSASIVSRGHRWPLPTGTLMGIPAEPSSVAGLLTRDEVDRLEHEVISGAVTGDTTVGDFVDARLGAAVTDRLVEPLLAGVYAGHARSLSLEMAVPGLVRAAREGTSALAAARGAVAAASASSTAGTPAFASLRGGLGRLPHELAAALGEAGVNVRTDATVRSLARRADRWVVVTGATNAQTEHDFAAIVLATPAAPTARLLADVAPASAAELARVQYASVAIVTLVVDGFPDELTGSSGFLVPPTEGLDVKASTFSSSKWPWLRAAAPDRTVLRASLGRHREERTLQRPDDLLVDTVLHDLRMVLGRLPDPMATHVQRWGGGLPQYAVGHRSLVQLVRAGLPPTLECGGAAYDGVGVPACIGSGRAAARRLLTRLSADGADLGDWTP